MEIKTSKNGIIITVEVIGRLDAASSAELEEKLDSIIDDGNKNIILDLKDLEYVSSSGLRVFLIILKKVSNLTGKFLLCNLKPNIREIFEISGFVDIFKIYNTPEEANQNM